MQSLLTLIVSTLLLVLESLVVHAFDLDTYTPHVACSLVVYLALERSMGKGAFQTVIIAWMADLIAAGPPGVYGLALTLLFLLLKVSSSQITYASVPVRAALSIVAAALVQAIVLVVLLALGQGDGLARAFVLAALPSTLLAPIGLWMSWSALERLDDAFQKKGLFGS